MCALEINPKGLFSRPSVLFSLPIEQASKTKTGIGKISVKQG